MFLKKDKKELGAGGGVKLTPPKKLKMTASRWMTAKECFEDRSLEAKLRQDVDLKMRYKERGITFE